MSENLDSPMEREFCEMPEDQSRVITYVEKGADREMTPPKPDAVAPIPDEEK